MSLCHKWEDALHRNMESRHRLPAPVSPAILACEHEQAWRQLGERAIREEMERRIVAWNLSHLPRLPRLKEA